MGGTAAAFPVPALPAPAFVHAAAFPDPAFVPARAGVGFGTCGSWASSFFPGTHLPFSRSCWATRARRLRDDMLPEMRETTRIGRGSAGPVAGVVHREGEEETRRGQGGEDEETRQFGINLLEDWKRNGLPTCLGFKG